MFTVTVGIFLIVTTEIMPIGVLTQIAADFQVSNGIAGVMMTIPGVVATIAAPTVTVATAQIDRRAMLCLLLAVLAVANLLTMVASAYRVVLLGRTLVGLTIGGFWSIGAGLADRLVPDNAVGTARAVIFSAVPLGSVLGVSAGTLLGQVAGWRMSFLVMGILAAAVTGALLPSLPALPPVRVTHASVLLVLLRGPRVRLGLAVTFLVVLAHFATYTYVTPFLEQVTRVNARTISTFLLVYGLAGLVGNILAGWAIARSLRCTFLVCGSLLAATLLLLPILGATNGVTLGLLAAWGLAYGAVPVCSQTWFLSSAPQAPEAATVLFTSSFQLTICIGALLGGVIVDATSTSTVMTCGAASAILMVVALANAPYRRRPAS